MTDRDWVRARVAGEIDQVRADTIKLAALTVLLTPALLLLSVAALVFVLGYVDLPLLDRAPFAISVVTGVNVILAFLIVTYFWYGKPAWLRGEADRKWELLGLGVFAGTVIVSYLPGLATGSPALFFTLYVAGALTTLGLFGHAYEGRDAYYTGLLGGAVDDPFTVEDDLDRAHMGMGIAAAIPSFLLSAYGEVFGATWVWRPISEAEAAAAADALLATWSGDVRGARAALRRLGPRSSRRVAHALRKLGWLKPGRVPALSLEGKKFVEEVTRAH